MLYYRIFSAMNLEDLSTLESLLSKPQSIVIVPHKNPDGDAIGSCLGLHLFLQQRGLQSKVVAPNDFPKFLKWMPGAEHIVVHEKENQEAEKLLSEASLIFTLDFNDFSRVGPNMEKSLARSKARFVMIDHHQQPSDYATATFSNVEKSSTCEMVYDLIEAMNGTAQLTPEIATNLYTGIMTDTGSFKYRSTTSATHTAAAKLIERGADNMAIHQHVFDSNSPSRLHLLGVALQNMVISPEYRTAYITLSQEELDTHNFKKGDTEGFVNYGLTLEGIIFAVIFIENKDEGIIKISFRSIGDFSVNQFARNHFNGGGHDNAAGGRSDVSLPETVAQFQKLLPQYAKQLNP